MKTQKLFLVLLLCSGMVYGMSSVWGQTNNQDQEIKVDSGILKSYVGRYAYTDGTISIIAYKDGQLYIQYTGQPELPIFPSSEDEFFLKVVEAHLKFIKDETGKVIHLVHRQNGMQFEPVRLSDENIIKVDPVIYDKYVGKYMGDNNQIIEVYKEGDKLFGRTPGLPVCQLLPVSETEFFPKEVNARVWFIISNDGLVNSANIDFNGYKSNAPRIRE
ncbi:MAG TPA: DUF3471 domain-containing protein [Bacteroidales bacterium]|nr:DUF3471 domain-containing protein [Bacteroidales bacterium]